MRDYEDKLNKAIKELETFKIMAKSESGEMAITMAIEALKREPVNKLTQQAYEDGKKDGYLQAKVDQALNTSWIPVSERLPEENKTVIASTKYGVYPETKYTKKYGWEWAYESGADYWRELEDVMAWMPLPPSYQGEEGSEE